MRLNNVLRGDRLSAKVLYRIVRIVSGFRAPDVVRTLGRSLPWLGYSARPSAPFASSAPGGPAHSIRPA